MLTILFYGAVVLSLGSCVDYSDAYGNSRKRVSVQNNNVAPQNYYNQPQRQVYSQQYQPYANPYNQQYAQQPYGQQYYQAPAASRYYNDPYAFQASGQQPYYDSDQYYKPPIYSSPSSDNQGPIDANITQNSSR